MNSFKTSLITKSIAAFCIAGGAAGSAAAQAALNVLGTPDDGMVCRTGYSASFINGVFLCKKFASLEFALECTNPRFPTYINRKALAGPNRDADVCILGENRPGYVAIITTSNLTNIPESVNGGPGVYELAKINPATQASEIARLDGAEAAALGLSAGSVDTAVDFAVIGLNDGGNGVRDKVNGRVRHHTFAVPTNGSFPNQGPIGVPAAANSTSSFTPRPVPR